MRTVLLFAIFALLGQSWGKMGNFKHKICANFVAINCWKQNMDLSADANKMEKEKCDAPATHCLWYTCGGKGKC